MNKPILCLDFDGVIHSYASGWTRADHIADEPVPGAIAFIAEASNSFRIAIYSARSGQRGGIWAMKRWLEEHALDRSVKHSKVVPLWLHDIEWPTSKPSAFVTLDDRAITFDGRWPRISELLNFKPWYKK